MLIKYQNPKNPIWLDHIKKNHKPLFPDNYALLNIGLLEYMFPKSVNSSYLDIPNRN